MSRVPNHWVAFGFCIALSAISLVAAVCGAFFGRPVGAWEPAFLGFLPMCFFFVATVTTDLKRQIADLKQQLEDIQQKSPSPDRPRGNHRPPAASGGPVTKRRHIGLSFLITAARSLKLGVDRVLQSPPRVHASSRHCWL